MSLGLPYQGGKSKYAERIVSEFPSGTNFIDCCCGGGAILQAAVMSSKFKTVTGIDINDSIIRLLQAVITGGLIDYEKQPLVSHQMFYDSLHRNDCLQDSLNIYTSSYGYKGLEYCWGTNKHYLKKLQVEILQSSDLNDRYRKLQEYTKYLLDKDNKPSEEFKSLVSNEMINSILRIKSVEDFYANLPNECLKPSVSTKSIFDIDYDKYDVIYFDPPYKNTLPYNRLKFDFDKFEQLLNELSHKQKIVFVSGYDMSIPYFHETLSIKTSTRLYLGKVMERTEKLYTNASYNGALGR